jgi:hypothetical protein
MLIVEDGTCPASADAYVSVAGADSRLSARGLTLWATLSQGEKEASIRRATDYMEQTYRSRWAGSRASRSQALSWPRTGVEVDGFTVGSDEIPAELVSACADLAFRAAFRELSKDTGTTQEKQAVKVGPIETTYVVGSALKARYTAVDEMLKPLLSTGGGMIRLVRA